MISKVVNVVATASLNQRIDLREISRLEFVIHDDLIYGGLVAYFKSPDMVGKVSLFSSGKMISVGTKSEDTAASELRRVRDHLVAKGLIDPVHLEPKTQNIVVLVDFQMNLDLYGLAGAVQIMYEPEQFPGAILKLESPHRTTVLVFASGKAVILGLKRSDQIEPVVGKLRRMFGGSEG